MEETHYLPLFETKEAEGRRLYWFYATSMAAAISLSCIYRVSHFPQENGLKTWAWAGLFMADLWFITYWIITQFARYRPIHRYTFKHRLPGSIHPGVDIFVSTADAQLEPPLMVVNTVLSVMAYDYPSDKLNVYLSDDGCSDLMFHALLEASRFARFWLPFCRNFDVEPRAPGVYFSTVKQPPGHDIDAQKWNKVKKLYEEMEARINDSMKQGRVPDHLRKQHKGFREWELVASRRDHQTILEILIDGMNTKEVDVEGKPLPTLVYLAREKRPGYPHNFKAGSMNALIRVSSRISNSQIILNLDCDHYSNNSQSVRDVLCFFMDDKQSNNIGFVQYPQYFDNITKNDLYGTSLRVPVEVELAALDANGGPPYIGSCCFHRRDALMGKKYEKGSHINWKQVNVIQESEKEAEETVKLLASCSYEENSSWGKEMGLKYGCPVEDIVTGLSVKCKGWRSIFYNPKRKGFMGVGPMTLLSALIQHTRWSEGHFQIFLRKYNPLLYGHGKIPVQLQISYLCYNLWGANCLATLYYVIVPPFCYLKGISLFPQFTSFWVLPYAYIFVAKYTYSLGEFLWSGGTVKGWYNDQRMWLYKRVTCYLYGFFLTILRYMGFAKLDFAITRKNADDDVSKRFEQEIMEFGADSSMFIILATIALFNLLTLISIARSIIIKNSDIDFDSYAIQIVLSGLVVVINLPLFEALFLRKDQGRMPASVTYKSLIFAAMAYLSTIY